MKDSIAVIALKHLLLESKFLVVGFAAVLFLGLPYVKITGVLYADYITLQQTTSLKDNFETTTGIISKIYQQKSYLPGKKLSYVFEFSYLDKQAKIITLDKSHLANNKVGDQVLVMYNANAAIIEHIPPYLIKNSSLALMLIVSTLGLLVPSMLGLILIINKTLQVIQIYRLHNKGLHATGTVTYFKPLRNNNYLIEYLYKPEHTAIKLRKRTKACNYGQVGEKQLGESIDILYDPQFPLITCIHEKKI